MKKQLNYNKYTKTLHKLFKFFYVFNTKQQLKF